MEEIVISGGGYCGLTGAVHACLAGFKVIIFDVDKATVDSINSGQPRAGEYLGYINENVKDLVDKGLLFATTDFDSIKTKPVHFLDVPTEKENFPHLNIIKNCIITLSQTIPDGGLIIIESTLQPGTIDSILPQIKRKIGEDLFLAVAFRVDWFADNEKNLTNLPRYVGGVTPNCTQKAIDIISHICKDTRETTYRAAEVAKAAQNALYFVQIQAAYELCKNYQNFTDMNEVLKLVSSHWRLPNLYLGPGTSGRCVAMGAKLILEGARCLPGSSWMPLFDQALHNDTQWRYLIGDLITKKFNYEQSKKVRILVMGVAYCPNFSDFGYSAGLHIAEYLYNHGWKTFIHDPIVPESTLEKTTKIPFKELSSEFDVVLLATAHNQYLQLPLNETLWKQGATVVDATGGWEKYRDHFDSYGVKYIRVGEQGWVDK